MSGTCIKRILPTTEKFRFLAVPLQAGFTVQHVAVCDWGIYYYSRQGIPYHTYAWI